MKQSLYDAIGGMPTLEKVHKIFYDKMYAHPWLGKFFVGHNQKSIEDRQSSFTSENMGGPIKYWGKPPLMAHRHMYITDEMFELRHALLTKSIQEVGVPEELMQRWLKIDNAFKKHVVKDSIAAFYHNTFKYEKRKIFPKPNENF